MSVIPGSMGYPYVGESVSFFLGPRQFANERFAQHGDVFKTHVLDKDLVFVGNKALAHFVLDDVQGQFSQKMFTKVEELTEVGCVWCECVWI
jgi:hypothetical protein